MNVRVDRQAFDRAWGHGTPYLASSVQHFAFLLLDGFSSLSFTTAVETLRIGNRAASQDVFSWSTHSENGNPVISSQGLHQHVDTDLSTLDRHTVLLVCGGERIETAASPRILGWIRKQAAHGCHVGGLCNAAWTLAEAGLLENSETTIHWENEYSFAERFPNTALTGKPYVLQGNRSATAGGTASIDLILEFIARKAGQSLARTVSERMLYGAIHKLQSNSIITLSSRIGMSNSKMRVAIDFIEQNLDDEIGPNDVAAAAGISVRQLERLFRQHLKQSPKRFLTGMRLDRAYRLLIQTEMSILDIAIASGFSSASCFSKSFVARFGQTPTRIRTTALSR